MSDAAAQIAREAKGLQQGLKELLKTRDILDREIEIQRKNLRRQYLRLLLVYPYAKESKDAETHLWMLTSYAPISIYKQRIATLDRAIHNPPRQPQQPPQSSRVVEYRKLLQRFRQFLAEEEKFWTQLIVRLRRNFAIDDAQAALTALSILPEEEQQPPVTEVNTPRRNQYQFPPESDSVEAITPPSTSAQRESRLAILSKALVCLGDIARYKELYNESGGRPRAGHEDGPPAASAAGRNGRGRRGGAPPVAPMMPRLRNYDRAQQCYEQARLLLPHDGNPSHQLAILASYQKDVFNSLVHYYRALCVRQPYDTAAENLGTVLHRALEQWKTRGAQREQERERDITNGNPASLAPRIRVEAFKEKVIVLHAQWRFGIDGTEPVGDKVLTEFDSLVSDRVLPIDMISKVIVLAQGALWKQHMGRKSSKDDKKTPRSPSQESQIVTHLLALYRVLLEIGSIQLKESPPEDAAEHDLAQRITATFRRTLPALRMSGKWLRANTRYLSQARKPGDPDTTPPTPNGKQRGKPRDGKGDKDKTGNAYPVVIDGLPIFWREYTSFFSTLTAAFPSEELPMLSAPLEEDTEMVGFLPLRKYMGVEVKSPGPGKVNGVKENAAGRDQVHPNEEQLMRIADLLIDAKAIAVDENTPVTLVDNRFVVRSLENGVSKSGVGPVVSAPHKAAVTPLAASPVAERSPAAQQNELVEQKSELEDDAMSMTAGAGDDLVREAIDHALNGSDDEDEDDEIVWNPSASLSPRQELAFISGPTTPQKPTPTSPISPKVSDYSPRKIEPISPFRPMDMPRTSPTTTTAPGVTGTTAQDLLNNVMGFSHPPTSSQHSSHHIRGASSPAAPLLFGSNGLPQSIWSTQLGSNELKYPTVPSNGLMGPPLNGLSHNVPPSHMSTAYTAPGYAQTPWDLTLSSSQPASSQFLSSPPSYNPQPSTAYIGGHHKLPSESIAMPRSQLFPTQIPNRRYDPIISSLPIAEHANIPIGSQSIAPPAIYMDTIYSSSPNYATSPGSTFYRQDGREQHYNSTGVLPPSGIKQRTFAAPPYLSTSSIWGHPG